MVKDYAFEIKDDKSLWERVIFPDGTEELLLVEESYYDGIVEDVEKLQKEIEGLKQDLEMDREYLDREKNRSELLNIRCKRYEEALGEIAEETGTPYAKRAKEVLERNNPFYKGYKPTKFFITDEDIEIAVKRARQERSSVIIGESFLEWEEDSTEEGNS